MSSVNMSISKDKKRAIVMGASGLVGSKLVEELVMHKAYESILSIGRSAPAYESDKIHHTPMDFEQMDIEDKRINGHDLYIAFGTTRARAGSKEKFREVDYEYPLKVINSAYANGVNQVILVSSVGADPESMFYYSQIKGELEEALCEIPFWGIHIFQPSLLLGERNENRFGEHIAQYIGKGLNFLTGGLVFKYKPVEAEIVARAMIRASQNMKKGVHVYPSSDIQQMAENYDIKLRNSTE